MLSVRQSNGFWPLAAGLAALMFVQGCSGSTVRRFAPPGIFKFEEIASEKPPNPVIEERIREHRRENRGASFPIIARTPSRGDPPPQPPMEMRSVVSGELVAAREDLAEEVAQDRAAAESAGEQREAIVESVDALADQLERDAAVARAERRNSDLQRP